VFLESPPFSKGGQGGFESYFLSNLVEKVNGKTIDLINNVKCAGLTEGMNSYVESRDVLHKRSPLLLFRSSHYQLG